VDDEGLDWDGAAPPPSTGNRRGNGVALENLRERLHTLYGEAASLTLSPRHPGTRARIELPWQIADTSTPARKD
jgi:LytS/YehU family sensor histidine kinase